MGSGRPFRLPGFATVVTCATMATASSLTPMSVLHIVADDMRPELGAYGSPNAVTPNLDGLAAKSAVFVNAFCQQPICSPSRNSFMSGYRPQTIGVYNFINYFRQKFPNATSFPQFFKQQPGYAPYSLLPFGMGELASLLPCVREKRCPVAGLVTDIVAVPTDVALQVRKHYFAAITYVDGLVGQLLQELDTLGMTDSTVVVFHSDHGYFQGESGEWEKQVLCTVPLIIHDPTHPVHIRVTTPVELIDVYPTAAALVLNTVPTEIDGVSVAALVRGSTLASPKNYAFTAYPRCVQNRTSIAPPTCFELDASKITFFGYSVRSVDWRYTEWRTWNGATLEADWTGPPVELELYNHTGHFADSERAFDFEQINRAADPTLADVRASLSGVLHAQFNPSGQ